MNEIHDLSPRNMYIPMLNCSAEVHKRNVMMPYCPGIDFWDCKGVGWLHSFD